MDSIALKQAKEDAAEARTRAEIAKLRFCNKVNACERACEQRNFGRAAALKDELALARQNVQIADLRARMAEQKVGKLSPCTDRARARSNDSVQSASAHELARASQAYTRAQAALRSRMPSDSVLSSASLLRAGSAPLVRSLNMLRMSMRAVGSIQ